MEKITLKAYAKINIGLDVTGKREDGYHLLNSVMQQVNLFDEVTVEKTESGIELDSNNKMIPLDEKNLAWKAAAKMLDTYNINGGVRIYIDKRIPMAAGMAGGSTDGAAVFVAMNKLFELGLSEDELCNISVSLGADIPFCIKGKTAQCEGIGDVMTKIESAPEMYALIVKPDIEVSTKYVYQNLNLATVKHPDMDAILDGFETKNLNKICENLGNVLASVTMGKYDVLAKLKDDIDVAGAVGSLMSGSGPTMFGLFDSFDRAKEAEREVAVKNPDCFVKAVEVIR